MIAKVTTATLLGLEAVPVRIEVDISNGLPGLHIVGLPDKSVDEARERVRSAIRASGQTLPPQRITVNLAPADLKKEGPAFDLPIAVGILAAAGQVSVPPTDMLFSGELSLNGELGAVRGALSVATAFAREIVATMVIPSANAPEALLAAGPAVLPAASLQEVIDHLRGERLLEAGSSGASLEPELRDPAVDFSDVRGQQTAKRALELAAAGGHNVLLSGPPGTGKTLLAKALAGILPPLSRSEVLEVTKVYSVAGLLTPDVPLVHQRPFRSPHHSISLPGLIGGGGWPRPGEMSLAHRGVLYLDEIPQFPKTALEAMRGPLEDGVVRISRAQRSLWFPTEVLLVASENPCPCGFASDPVQACTCSAASIERYRQKLSGPIRDRFDMTIEVPRLPFEKLHLKDGETSAEVRQRVSLARQRQTARFGSSRVNAHMGIRELETYCPLSEPAEALLGQAVNRWNLSARAYHRLIKIARTVADLAGREEITDQEVAEAVQYRLPSSLVAA